MREVRESIKNRALQLLQMLKIETNQKKSLYEQKRNMLNNQFYAMSKEEQQRKEDEIKKLEAEVDDAREIYLRIKNSVKQMEKCISEMNSLEEKSNAKFGDITESSYKLEKLMNVIRRDTKIDGLDLTLVQIDVPSENLTHDPNPANPLDYDFQQKQGFENGELVFEETYIGNASIHEKKEITLAYERMDINDGHSPSRIGKVRNPDKDIIFHEKSDNEHGTISEIDRPMIDRDGKVIGEVHSRNQENTHKIDDHFKTTLTTDMVVPGEGGALKVMRTICTNFGNGHVVRKDFYFETDRETYDKMRESEPMEMPKDARMLAQASIDEHKETSFVTLYDKSGEMTAWGKYTKYGNSYTLENQKHFDQDGVVHSEDELTGNEKSVPSSFEENEFSDTDLFSTDVDIPIDLYEATINDDLSQLPLARQLPQVVLDDKKMASRKRVNKEQTKMNKDL